MRIFLRYSFLNTGFVHTAYTFANESRVLESGAAGNDVPMGALINIIQVFFCYSFKFTPSVKFCYLSNL